MCIMAEKKNKKKATPRIEAKEGIEEIFATSPNRGKDDFTKSKPKKKKKKQNTINKKDKNVNIEKAKEESKVKQEVLELKESNDKKIELLLLGIMISIALFGILFLWMFQNINHKVHLLDQQIKNSKPEAKVEYINPKTIFFGDSITYRFDLNKYFDHDHINKGWDGDTTEKLLERIKEDVIDYQPQKLFLLIGTNDLGTGKTPTEVVNNIDKIIRTIQSESKNTKIYVESILPINNSSNRKIEHDLGERKNSIIKQTNQELEKVCQKRNVTYIHTYDEFLDEEKNLKLDYTDDGLHLNDEGYNQLVNKIKKYLN